MDNQTTFTIEEVAEILKGLTPDPFWNANSNVAFNLWFMIVNRFAEKLNEDERQKLFDLLMNVVIREKENVQENFQHRRNQRDIE